MAKESSLAERWHALVQLAKVHEPKLHGYIHVGRVKSETNYNIQVVGKTEEDTQQILRGVKVFGDLLEKLTEMAWGESKGIKVAAADPGDLDLWAEPVGDLDADEELRRVAWEKFYPEIRQQVAEEMESAGTVPDESAIAARLLEEMKRNREHAEIEERIALIGRGNEELTIALKTWEKLLKFVENRDLKKLDALAREMDEKMTGFLRTLMKLEK